MAATETRVVRVRRAGLCGAVALALVGFIPPVFPTADAFETPRLAAWCMALCAAIAAGAVRRSGMAEKAAWALLAWMALRTIVAGNAHDVMAFVGWLLPPALYLAARRLDGATRRAVAQTCLWAGVAEAVLMVMQRFGIDPFFAETTREMAYAPGRMIGTVGYHNQAVDLVAVCAALAMAPWACSSAGEGLLMRMCRPRSGSCGRAVRAPATARPAVGPYLCGRAIYALAALAAVAMLAALAAYRAGLVGVLLGSVFLALSRPKWAVGSRAFPGRRAVGLAVLALAVVAAAVSAVPETRGRVEEALRRPLAAPAMRTRATMAHVAWTMIRERPLAGHGSGTYAFQYLERLGALLPAVKTHDDLQAVEYAREPHNDLVHLWSEFGLAGVVLCAGWLVAALRKAPSALRWLAGYWVAASCFGFPWHDAAAGPLAGLALGLLQGGDAEESVSEPRRFGSDAWSLSSAVCAALCVAQMGVDAGWWTPLPWQGRAQARFGGLAAIDGRWAEAERWLVASRRTERSPEQCNNLGFVWMHREEPEKAEAVYREWARSGIDHKRALTSLAGALEAQGKWKEAAETLLLRHRLWPRESEDRDVFRTVALLLRGGDAEEARRLADDFHRRNGGTTRWTAEWENLLGAALLRLGDRQAAGLHFETALRMNPAQESARRNLEGLDRVAPIPRP